MTNVQQSSELRQSLQDGMAHFEAERWSAAEEIFKRIVTVHPEFSDGWDWLGRIALRMKHPQRAVEMFDHALALSPDNSVIHKNRGVALAMQGAWDAALLEFQRSLEIDPNYADGHIAVGNVFMARQRPEQALICYQRALALNGDSAKAHSNLGIALQRLGRSDDAIESYRQALALDPNFADAHINLGTVLHESGKLTEALDCYRQALALKPDIIDTHNNLGMVLRSLGKLSEAETHFHQALQLQPDSVHAQGGLATIALLSGDLETGFALYETRFAGSDKSLSALFQRNQTRLTGKARWQGEPLQGRRLLVWREQGIGDAIMMMRYLPLLKDKGAGQIVVSCWPEMMRLLQTLPEIDRVIDDRIPPPQTDFDCHCPLMSLPFLFATQLDTIPNMVPYIHVPPDLDEKWAQRLSKVDGLKVGLTWAGSRTQGFDFMRSVSLERFSPLWAIPGVHFISLQKGEPIDDAPLLDCMGECQDFLDTAALIQQLDLVISVDTAVAHLAGALAKPVWLLNCYETEWRWLLDREDSPWYPTMRIYRQPTPQDWDGVITKITEELRILSA